MILQKKLKKTKAAICPKGMSLVVDHHSGMVSLLSYTQLP